MSRRNIILSGIGLAFGFAWLCVGFVWFTNAQAERSLEQARQSLQAAFVADTPERRREHVNECARISETLLKTHGQTGTIAALFAIGVSPAADFRTAATMPSVKRVKDLSSADLLLILEVLSKTGQFGVADQLLDLLLSRHDEFREQTLRLATTIRSELGRDEEVLTYSDELAELNDADPSPYRIKANVHRRHGRWDHYLKAVEMAKTRTPQPDSRLQIEIIDGYIHVGRYEEARRDFDKLAREHPELIAQLPTVRARLLIQEGQEEEAITVLSAYLASDPNDVEALVLKGKVLIGERKFAEGVEVLELALQVEPSSEEACFQMGQAYARMGKPELANRYSERHRKLLDNKVRLYELEQQAAHQPHNVAVRLELAELYASIELHDLAAFWARAADAARGM
jgi:tetratricopeptide (TPR) repeat protein